MLSDLKKIWMGVGPVFCAFMIVGLLFTFDIHLPLPAKEVEYQATARNYSVLKGEYVRNQILSNDLYVPFYSSSEMAIFDEFHPNMLDEKYDRNYRPYIAGRDAQGALTHFLEITSTKENHQNKKVVYLLSPNSFQSSKGIPDQFYQTVHSRLEISHWLLDIEEITADEEYAAKRLLGYKVVKEDHLLAPILKKISKKEIPNTLDKLKLEQKYRQLRGEDNLFSWGRSTQFSAKTIPEEDTLNGMYNYQYAKEYKMSHLPDVYNLEKLDELAYNIGKESSTNNEFVFFNPKYKKDIGNNLKDFKNYREKITYTNSVEYGDLQLVLEEFAELEMDPLIIFMPIDEKWIQYTGTPQSEMNGLIDKLTYQLTSQGFHNFLVVDGKREYTHIDPAHAGRRAWVEVDKTLNEFLSNKKHTKQSYKINDYFLTEEWATTRTIPQ